MSELISKFRIIDTSFMRLALRLARRGYGATSPNPMVGAVLVKKGKIIGRGWHRRAGLPHAEIEAICDAQKRGQSVAGATLYVTLEPCCTHGRTPPCTDAIISAGIRRVVVGATDPNHRHSGAGQTILQRAGIHVITGILAQEALQLNEVFNHWIVHKTPFVNVKAAMTLDGKISTAHGESKWITGEPARAYGMNLRQGSDAILVGINTVLNDDPSLTYRRTEAHRKQNNEDKRLRRIVLDSMARTPLTAKVVRDAHASFTTIVVSKRAPKRRVAALAKRVNVLMSPPNHSERQTKNLRINLRWLLKELGKEGVTSLLVEGGGEVNASFLIGGLAHRITFFYAPKIIGGHDARKAVGGEGVLRLEDAIGLKDVQWRKLGDDLLLTSRVNK